MPVDGASAESDRCRSRKEQENIFVSEKVIISAALTGAVTPKEKNPHVPITPEEIAEWEQLSGNRPASDLSPR